MNRGLRLGRVLGIQVILDYSWFFIGLLIAWSFGTLYAEELVPDLRNSAHVAMGISTTVLFFISLLAHELAHSVVARRKGVPVDSITLFIFGGVARMDREPDGPGDEFFIAAAGPVVSFLLSGGFFGVYWLSLVLENPAPAAMFGVLSFVNLALGGFNLLPGYPLDGGRILRSAVWKATGDMSRATRFAANGGRLIAVGIVGLGGLRLAQGEIFGGIWLILIGTFIFQMAAASHRRAKAEKVLEGVVVADVMDPSPPTLPGNMRVEELFDDRFILARHTAYPVIGVGDEVEGLITVQNISATPREAWSELTVRQIMTPVSDDITVHPSEKITILIEKSGRNPEGRFLVLDEGGLVGMISFADVARRLKVASVLESRA